MTGFSGLTVMEHTGLSLRVAWKQDLCFHQLCLDMGLSGTRATGDETSKMSNVFLYEGNPSGGGRECAERECEVLIDINGGILRRKGWNAVGHLLSCMGTGISFQSHHQADEGHPFPQEQAGLPPGF